MSRPNPRIRLASVAAPIEPRARTTCRSTAEPDAGTGVPGAFTLQSRWRSGMMQRDPSSFLTEVLPGGEHEVGDEADAAERAATTAQSVDPLPRPLRGQDGARGGRLHRAYRRRHRRRPGRPRGDPRPGQ